MGSEAATGSGAQETSSTSGLSTGITRSTTWWIVWAGVAVEALRRSEAARRVRLAGENRHPHLRYEIEDGLVAVTGSVFAVEAITRQLTQVDNIVDPQTRARWAGQQKKAAWRTCEVLKRCIRGGEGQALGEQWKPLIDRRNGVVHFVAEQRPSVSYDGMNIAVEDAEFTAVEAARTVDLLFTTLEGLGTRFKLVAQEHAAGFVGQLEELRERRRVGGVPTTWGPPRGTRPDRSSD